MLSSMILGKDPDVLSGLYHAHMEKDGPILMDGMVKNCLRVFALVARSPPGCAKDTPLRRSVREPGVYAGLPVGIRLPVTLDASTRKAFGWNG